jgi:hypothetical protein
LKQGSTFRSQLIILPSLPFLLLPCRYYDAIMMRNEYDILKAKALGSSG